LVDVNWNVADVAVVGPAGALVIDVSGGVIAICHVCVAGVVSALPAWSVEATVNVCVPSARPLYDTPLTQSTAGAPSSEQRYVAAVGSVDVNWNVADVDEDGSDGALVIEVSGAVESIVQLNDAGVGSTLPIGSVARTSNV
jgi:hypothetical protein